MGQHTWFHKDRTLYEEEMGLWEKLDKYDMGEIYLDDMELLQINHRIDEVHNLNETDYHDLFRTNKRNEDGTYSTDVIYSEKECYEWLKENSEFIYGEILYDKLKEFWKNYPNGVIDFG